MKEYIIKIKDRVIELSEKPEIYLFADESCSKSDWVPFDMNKLKETQRWVQRKIIEERVYPFQNNVRIQFKLKNPDDVNVFTDWMSTYSEVMFKKDYAKDIEFYEFDDHINTEEATFLNSVLSSIDDEYVKLVVDHIA